MVLSSPRGFLQDPFCRGVSLDKRIRSENVLTHKVCPKSQIHALLN